MTKRILSILLIVAMLLSMAVSCAKAPSAPADSTEATEEEAQNTAISIIKDGKPSLHLITR